MAVPSDAVIKHAVSLAMILTQLTLHPVNSCVDLYGKIELVVQGDWGRMTYWVSEEGCNVILTIREVTYE